MAHFWQHHDLTNFEDDLEEVTEPVFARAELSTATIVNVHYHEDTLIVVLFGDAK